jgi:hypothetical protein
MLSQKFFQGKPILVAAEQEYLWIWLHANLHLARCTNGTIWAIAVWSATRTEISRFSMKERLHAGRGPSRLSGIARTLGVLTQVKDGGDVPGRE